MSQAVCPVTAAHVEDLGRSLPEMDLDTVPIEFDLVNPASAGWQLLDLGRQCKLTNSGEGRLTPIATKPLVGSGVPMPPDLQAVCCFLVVSDMLPYLASDVQRAHPAIEEK